MFPSALFVWYNLLFLTCQSRRLLCRTAAFLFKPLISRQFLFRQRKGVPALLIIDIGQNAHLAPAKELPLCVGRFFALFPL